MLVLYVMVVVDDCFWNFDLEVVIGLPCFACDAVDYFDYGWRKSAFVDFVDFVVMVADFADNDSE